MRQTDKAASQAASKKKTTSPDVAKARLQTGLAFQILGLLTDGKAHGCPVCNANGTAHSPKTKFFEDGGWNCRRCGAFGGPTMLKGGTKAKPNPSNQGNGLDVLLTAGYSFKDAVDLLNGRETKEGIKPPEAVLVNAEPDFNAEIDAEVYQFMVDFGSVEKAVEFYGRWFISEEVVRESRAVYIENSMKLAQELIAKFGSERVVAAGLTSAKQNILFSDRYPVIEPHVRPDGTVVGMQFRASPAQEKEIKKFKDYSNRKKAAQTAGLQFLEEKMDHIPKFCSLRGATRASRIGFGIERMASLTEPKRIWIVEGFKDLLAARTMKLEAYGLPGVGVLPVRAVCRILAEHHIVIAYDADEGGDAGRVRLERHLLSHGIAPLDTPNEVLKELTPESLKVFKYRKQKGLTFTNKVPPEGQDMTDVLVAKNQN